MSDEINVGSVVATVALETDKADDALSKITNLLHKFGTALEQATAVVDKLVAKTSEITPAATTANTAMTNTAQAVNTVGTAATSTAVAVDKVNTSMANLILTRTFCAKSMSFKKTRRYRSLKLLSRR